MTSLPTGVPAEVGKAPYVAQPGSTTHSSKEEGDPASPPLSALYLDRGLF